MNNNKRPSILNLLRSSKWGYFYIVLGFVLVSMSGYDLVRYQDAKTWPSVQGTVQISKIRAHKEWMLSVFEPHLIYSYTVAGKGYTGDTVRIGHAKMMWSKEDATGLLQNYPAGKTVTVYYDPDEPTEALLELKIDKSRKQGSWVGFALIVFGGFWLRHRKR